MDALADLATWLKKTGLGWYLFGAQAAILRGSTRATADIDVTVVGTIDVVDGLLKSLPAVLARFNALLRSARRPPRSSRRRQTR